MTCGGQKIIVLYICFRKKTLCVYILIWNLIISSILLIKETLTYSYRGILILFFTFIFYSVDSVSGQDPVFSQFYAAPVYLNPAFAGSTNCSRAVFNYRMVRTIENLHTANFSYDRYIDRLSGGIGIIATSDQTNMYYKRNSVHAMYAYHLMVTADFSINFGMQAGYIRNDLQWDKFIFLDPDETEPENTWKHSADFAAGILFHSDRFYGGLSAHHLHEPQMSIFENAENSRLPIKITGHIGLYFEPGSNDPRRRDQPDYYFSPNIVFQHQGAYNHLSAGMYFGIKPVMLGVWYRHWMDQDGLRPNNFLVALVGINMEDYRIGLSYDVSTTGLSGDIYSALELSIAFRFNCPQRNIGGRIINHPSF